MNPDGRPNDSGGIILKIIVAVGEAFMKIFGCRPRMHVEPLALDKSEEAGPPCVYCENPIKRDDATEPFTIREARLVPNMCPWHFNIHWTRIYLNEPQDPNNICSRCTRFLRMYQPKCFYTSSDRRFRFIFSGWDVKTSLRSNNKYLTLDLFVLTTIFTLEIVIHIFQIISLLIILYGGTIMAERYVWFCNERNPVIRTIVAFTRRLFNAAFCLDRTEYEQLIVESMDEFDERPCVYCNENFRENNATLLTASEAQAVPNLRPEHFNRGKKRTFHRAPQNPRHVCEECTLMLRTLIYEYYSTVWNPME
ncbi:Hypothetical predicted protein [Cloeon dipterum]|uniref:Uncharacterized protein n=1 Tax=Cloeon dipterum TaxID=197152 RepID=A0A8S1DVL6_9INSE|nr:Hypothetical predicted protein [Cloeon dipterum]